MLSSRGHPLPSHRMRSSPSHSLSPSGTSSPLHHSSSTTSLTDFLPRALNDILESSNLVESSRPLTGTGSSAGRQGSGWTKGRKDSRTSLAHAPLSFNASGSNKRRCCSKRLLLLVLGTVVVVVWFGAKKRSESAAGKRLSPLEIERVWRWEIASGRYPSRAPVPLEFSHSLAQPSEEVLNPAVPSAEDSGLKQLAEGALRPAGHARSYYPIRSRPRSHAAQQSVDQRGRLVQGVTPRPRKGASIDMDVVLDHCDFSKGAYVKDCLEVLRHNAGLDTGVKVGKAPRSWEATYAKGELDAAAARGGGAGGASGGGARGPTLGESERQARAVARMSNVLNATQDEFAQLLDVQQKLTLSRESATADIVAETFENYPTQDPACDPDHPRIFHMFWVGAFTDKPYAAILSFLYTQNLHLGNPIGAPAPAGVCRPQLWMWMTPPSGVPDHKAREVMREDLRKNPWSGPLLDRRFEQSVKFLLWNTTEQLDATSEMEGWRDFAPFKDSQAAASAAKKKAQQQQQQQADADIALHNADAPLDPDHPAVAPPKPSKNELVGSMSDKYDRVSTVFSDMVRFVLTHRFGGIYLDADTLFLRDWEELFNYPGAFAYRWSRMEAYNTAVLKMDRGTALGSAIFKLAIKAGLKFHPFDVSSYLQEAKLDKLLLRVPDALFDPVWLNADYPKNFQRDRPPFPFFKDFEDFFKTPKEDSAAPLAIGFDGFYRGAFSYHWHNFWKDPFDPSRDFPDLGGRFSTPELRELKRQAVLKYHKLKGLPAPLAAPEGLVDGLAGVGVGAGGEKMVGRSTRGEGAEDDAPEVEVDEDAELDISAEERDMSWATVLKRTFEGYVRGERANAYGEWIEWDRIGDAY